MVDPNEDVTELSGIGSATKEKLEEKGISTVGDLADEYKRIGSRNLPNSRVANAARGAAMDLSLDDGGDGFEDLELGVTVTEENRTAVEKLGTKTLGDLSSVDTRDARKSVREVKGSDTKIGELAKPATEGRLGEQGAPQSLIGWASDAAANMMDTDLGSGQIQGVNELKAASNRTAETTRPSKADRGSDMPDDVEEQYELDPTEVSRAMDHHEDRPPKAQRVDERRKARRTDEITTWKSDPNSYDYVGVDTRAPMSAFFADERKRKRGGFGSYTRENRDEGKLRDELDKIQSFGGEVQERALGERVDFTPDRFF